MITRAFTALLLAGGLALTGCAAPTSYAGISLVPGATDPELQRLAQMARSGDKQAQLELGIRFEEGLGVERNIGKARKQYRQAASDSGGVIWVYQPPVKKGGSGRVMPVNFGARQKGLVEAARRLDALK